MNTTITKPMEKLRGETVANGWFESDVLPSLRKRIRRILLSA
jgi:hypothetical protein